METDKGEEHNEIANIPICSETFLTHIPRNHVEFTFACLSRNSIRPIVRGYCFLINDIDHGYASRKLFCLRGHRMSKEFEKSDETLRLLIHLSRRLRNTITARYCRVVLAISVTRLTSFICHLQLPLNRSIRFHSGLPLSNYA